MPECCVLLHTRLLFCCTIQFYDLPRSIVQVTAASCTTHSISAPHWARVIVTQVRTV